MINWFVERKPEDQISIRREYEVKMTQPIGKYIPGNKEAAVGWRLPTEASLPGN